MVNFSYGFLSSSFHMFAHPIGRLGDCLIELFLKKHAYSVREDGGLLRGQEWTPFWNILGSFMKLLCILISLVW